LHNKKIFFSVDPGIAHSAVVAVIARFDDNDELSEIIDVMAITVITTTALCFPARVCEMVDTIFNFTSSIVEEYDLPAEIIIEDYEVRPSAKSIRGSRTLAVVGGLIARYELRSDRFVVKNRHWTKNYSIKKAHCIAEKNIKIKKLLDYEQKLDDEHQVDAYRMLIGTLEKWGKFEKNRSN
jgi:hypothetical protein